MLKLNLPNSFHSPRKRKQCKRDFIFENKERIRLMTLNHFRLQHTKEPCGWRERHNTRLEDLVFRLTSSNTRLPLNRAEIIKDPKYRFPEQKRRKKRRKSISSHKSIESKTRNNVSHKSSTDFLRKFMSNVNNKNEERIMKELKRRAQMEATYGAVNAPRKNKQSSKRMNNQGTKSATMLQKPGTSKTQASITEDNSKNINPVIPVVSVQSSFEEKGCQYSEYDMDGNLKICYPSKYANLQISVNRDNNKNATPETEKKETNEVTTRKSYNDIFKRKGDSATQNVEPKRNGRRSKSTNPKKQQIIVASRYNKPKNKLSRTFNNDLIEQDTRPPPAEPFPDFYKQKKADGTVVKEKKKKLKLPSGHYVLPEKERLKTLKLLQKEFYRVWKDLRCLPIKSDIFEVKIKKIRLEEDLKELEKNIKSFSCSRVIIRPG